MAREIAVQGEGEDLWAVEVCADRGIELNYRLQPGYDHSYYFISTFIEDHLAHHARCLKASAL